MINALVTAMPRQMLVLRLHVLPNCAPLASLPNPMHHNPSATRPCCARYHPSHYKQGRTPTSTSWFMTLKTRLMPVSQALS
jgi:hypothetical protein